MAVDLNDISLQFQQSAYAEAISQLQSQLDKLDEYAAEYQDLKNQIDSFWEDSNSYQAKSILTDSIQKVYTARQAVADALKGIESGNTGFTNSNTTIQQNLENQKRIIDNLFS